MALQTDQYQSNCIWLSDFNNVSRNGEEKEVLYGGTGLGLEYAIHNSQQTFVNPLNSCKNLTHPSSDLCNSSLRPDADADDPNPIPFSSSISAVAAINPQFNVAMHHQSHQQHQNPRHHQFVSSSMINLSDLQIPPRSVSTGLSLSIEEEHRQQQIQIETDDPSFLFSSDLAVLLNQQQQEIDHLLRLHYERLRNSVAEKRRRQCGFLTSVAEGIANRKLQERESERERVVRQKVELEERMERMKAESRFWRNKVEDQETVVQSLQARLATEVTSLLKPLNEPEDCDSSNTGTEPGFVSCLGTCRACRAVEASVVVLPCRHLCLCLVCVLALPACPVCNAMRTGMIHVSGL